MSNPSFWCLGVLLSLAVGGETGVYAMVPLFLVNERAFNLAEANHLLGLSRVPGIVMVLLSGWITDRLSPSFTVSMSLAVTGAAIILLALGPDILVAPAVFLQAVAAACLFPPILAMASAIATTENRALTLSLSLAVAPVIGGGSSRPESLWPWPRSSVGALPGRNRSGRRSRFVRLRARRGRAGDRVRHRAGHGHKT
ncbi:MAG: MFS transporter [Desulfohalobiaceae bacterium]|nr:MFS transporter [Desulfohalobiaceae bacterium]